MHASLERLADIIDATNRMVGRGALWLALAMMLTQILTIGFLFLFDEGSLWLQESTLYFHAAYIALLLGYSFLHDAHVRIDIFYRDAPPEKQAIVNLIGSLVFLLPFCLLIIITAFPYALASWRIWEGSREASGIQAVYLLKSLIILAGLFLGLQALSSILRASLFLWKDAKE